MILGVGSLEPNEGGDEEEEPRVSKDEAWKVLIGEDGELKSWADVTALNAIKINIAAAMREYMRKAWGKVF